MARWYIERSPDTLDEDNEGELIAYQALKSLDDSWTIRWCYDYLDGKIEKEGDFLILGPDGRLLVLEVKTRARVFTPTGLRDGDAELRAEDQVQKQKAGVLDALEERYQQGGEELEKPWTVAAIFSAKEHGYQPKTHAHPFSLIGGPDHLRRLPQYWEEITSGGYKAHSHEAVLNLFHSVYGDASPEAEARFISETDRLLIEKASADFSLLEALSENSQLLVRGGPGSGKSWMAERHARMLASQGMNVLFLCFNKALGASLTQSVARLRIKGDEGSMVMRRPSAISRSFGPTLMALISNLPSLLSRPDPRRIKSIFPAKLWIHDLSPSSTSELSTRVRAIMMRTPVSLKKSTPRSSKYSEMNFPLRPGVSMNARSSPIRAIDERV
jgi:hypothetical protein